VGQAPLQSHSPCGCDHATCSYVAAQQQQQQHSSSSSSVRTVLLGPLVCVCQQRALNTCGLVRGSSALQQLQRTPVVGLINCWGCGVLPHLPRDLATVKRMPAPSPMRMLARFCGLVGSLKTRMPTIATGILFRAPTRL
jgi:hypothetical protein